MPILRTPHAGALMQTLVRLSKRLLDMFVKAVYHEFPVHDEQGHLIGSEFYTIHTGIVTRVIGGDRLPDQRQEESTSLSGHKGGPNPYWLCKGPG